MGAGPRPAVSLKIQDVNSLFLYLKLIIIKFLYKIIKVDVWLWLLRVESMLDSTHNWSRDQVI
jgi:hypothetical protein